MIWRWAFVTYFLWFIFTITCWITVSGSQQLWDMAYVASVEGVSNVLDKHSHSAYFDINYVDATHGRSALMICGLDPQDMDTLDSDCAAIAIMLMRHGALRRLGDYRGWSPLLLGASRGMTDYCDALLTWNMTGAEIVGVDDVYDIDWVDPVESRSALMLAATNGHFETTKMLLSHGASMQMQSNQGQTAFHLATARVVANMTKNRFTLYKDLVEIAEKVKAVDNRDKDNRTALMYAVLGRSHDVVALLLKAGADPVIVDRYNVSVQTMASRSPVIQELIMQAQMDRILQQHENWLKKTEATQGIPRVGEGQVDAEL